MQKDNIVTECLSIEEYKTLVSFLRTTDMSEESFSTGFNPLGHRFDCLSFTTSVQQVVILLLLFWCATASNSASPLVGSSTHNHLAYF